MILTDCTFIRKQKCFDHFESMGTSLGCKSPVSTVISFHIIKNDHVTDISHHLIFIFRYTLWTFTYGTLFYLLLLVVLWVPEIALGRYIVLFYFLVPFMDSSSINFAQC
jgi:hypothetical protein